MLDVSFFSLHQYFNCEILPNNLRIPEMVFVRLAMREFSCQVFRVVLFLSIIASSTGAFAGLPSRPRIDYDGDGNADISVYRRSDQYWYIQKSSGGYSFIKWGNGTDNPVPGDYTGDGKTDIAVFRSLFPLLDPDSGTWWVFDLEHSAWSMNQWGSTWWPYTDIAVPADYDGDGKTDLACYRVSDQQGEAARFFVLLSSTGSGTILDWGDPWLGDRPVPADYDGDGKADIAIYRNGEWWIRQSSDGSVRIEQFGFASDKVVPGDFDGDGKADIAVWRPSDGIWYWRSSQNGVVNYVRFGLEEDKPVPDDFDGDGKTDIAVFRPSSGIWYILRSTDGNLAYDYFGLSSDIPIQNVFVR